jgi:hypothetical protein
VFALSLAGFIGNSSPSVSMKAEEEKEAKAISTNEVLRSDTAL